MRIDIHAHCFPADYLELLARDGDMSALGLRGLGAGDEPDEVATRLELMDSCEVQVQVLSSSLGPYLPDEDGAVAAARLANDRFADLVAGHPDRFAAFAVLPLPHVGAALAELDRALIAPGFAGVIASSSILGRSIADAAFEPIYAELDRRASVLFLHPAGRSAESPLIAESGLSWTIGAPIEDTIIVIHVLARGILTRFPRLRIVNSHLGGAMPMLMARLDDLFPRAVPDAPEAPGVAARRMWYDTVSHAHRPALVAAHASFGAAQLILGTDYPFVRGDQYREAVRYVTDAGLPPEDAAAILAGNATAFLGP
jgi:6-methylsalicylate decarboxylase